MIDIIWEFRVSPERQQEFELAYNSTGIWAKLFGNSREYRETVLLRDPSNAGRYLTVDCWSSETAFREFKQEFAAEYAAIDARCEALTESETFVGIFERV